MTKKKDAYRTLDLVKSRCREDGGCWIWLGCMQKCGTTPVMRRPDGTRRTTQVRRLVLECKGIDLTGLVTTYTCESPKCVNPEHVVAMPRGELQTRTNKTLSRPARMKRNKAIAQGQRRRSKLTPEIVELIRQSPFDQRTLARYLGVSQYAIYAALCGRTWKPLVDTNPFAGLFHI